MPRTKKETRSFEELLQQLQTTIAELEQGQVTLEDMLARYAEGVELVQACQNLLNQAETRLNKVKEDN
jgi:exodeoxyribonuclease VII small subunit